MSQEKENAASPVEQPAAAPIHEPTIPDELHPDTSKLVRRFARALANKLLAAQRKYGYSDNWMRDGWADECRAELMRHIQKGDPRDVAAYCAFLWHHNESTAPAPADEREAFAEVRFELETIRDGASHWRGMPGGWSGTTAACNRALDALARVSANETGAEPCAWLVEWTPNVSDKVWVQSFVNELDAINKQRQVGGRIIACAPINALSHAPAQAAEPVKGGGDA